MGRLSAGAWAQFYHRDSKFSTDLPFHCIEQLTSCNEVRKHKEEHWGNCGLWHEQAFAV